jgi:class 3 adenylate cyclase
VASAADEQDEVRGATGSETERRRATVLFADITGFTSLVEQAGDEEAYEIIGACLRLLDAIVVKHGGRVEKHAGDCVVAVFGAPVAIENAPRAAVNAALEMRKAVREYNRRRGVARPLEVHSGVNTGSVIADPGRFGADLPVFGDVVNVASRLKDQAPAGEIWVGPETWRATHAEFEYRALEPIALKGKQEKLAVYSLLSAEHHVHRPRAGTGAISSPLVGRDAELARLRERIAALARGESGVVSIVAEAGLGKSRLCAELEASAEAGGARWLEGRSLSTGQGHGHHPFIDLFRSWAGIGADDGAAALGKLEAALGALLGDAAADVLPFLATLMNVRLRADERRRMQAVQDDARAPLLALAVGRVLARLAEERPLVLVFEDLHWADGSSIELLLELLRPGAIGPALFVLASRPHHPETSGRVLEWLRRERPDAVSIELAPLDAPAAARLVDNLFAGGDVPPATRAAILAKVAGNPFFAEEVVRSLVDDGAIAVRDGRLVATERIHAAVIPGSVEETLQARLDRLPLASRRVLETAAVIGATFWVPVLAEVLEKNGLEEILPALADAGLVVAGDAEEWSFKHPLIQEVAYGALLRARREDLHRRVAQAIEIWLTDRVPGYHAMLAYHFGRGRDLERAEEYLFRAGEQAAGAAAPNEALHFFREAAALYLRLHGEGGDPAQKARLEKHLGMALMNRGQLGEAVERFARALAFLGDPVSRTSSQLYRGLAWDLTVVTLGLYLPRRSARVAATDAQREQIDIRFRRGLAQTTTAPGPVILADTVATLRRLERIDPASVPEAGGIYSGAIAIFSWGGVSFELGRRILERARAVVEAGNVRELMLYYRLMCWIHHYLSGDWSAQHDIDDALLEEGLRYGRLWEVQTFLDLDAERRIQRGDWEGARRRLAELADFNAQYRHGTAIAAQRANTAHLHLERRELAAALAAVERYYREHGEASFQLQALGMLAKAHALGGDLAAAEQALARADELVQRAGAQPPFHASRTDTARLRVEIARLDAASGSGRGGARGLARRAERARRAALRGAAKVAARRPEVWRLAGTLDALRGRRRAAGRRFEQSLGAAEALGMGPEAARTWREAARRGVPLRGADAATCRERAARLFDAHGLAAELDEREA